MANEIGKFDALQSLKPDAKFVVSGDTIEWHSDGITQPTLAAVDAEVIRLQGSL